MTPHAKIYLDTFQYTVTDYIPCEIPKCGSKSVDIHHIDARGMGGSQNSNDPENLMALCRYCHIKYGDKTTFKDWLRNIHIEAYKKRMMKLTREKAIASGMTGKEMLKHIKERKQQLLKHGRKITKL